MDAGRDALPARCSPMRRRFGSDGVRLARALTRSKKSCRCIGQSSGISLAVSIVRRISKRSGSAVGGETSSDSSDMIPAGLRGREEDDARSRCKVRGDCARECPHSTRAHDGRAVVPVPRARERAKLKRAL